MLGIRFVLCYSQHLSPVYYVVTDPEGDPIRTVEADSAEDAVDAVDTDGRYDVEELQARKADTAEAFRYLVDEIGLSYIQLGKRLDVSENYIGHRMRDQRDVRRLDVLALERLRQLREH